MQMELGDIVDRLSILALKCERLGSDSFGEEFITYSSQLLFYEEDMSRLQVAISALRKLYNINKAIWDLEADIRNGKEGKLGLEEVGRRAIKIREYNKMRVEIKNTLCKFKDIKKDHASE